jgi:DtxR family transcriptional regulator, Mn-dependent transcriptional regulator
LYAVQTADINTLKNQKLLIILQKNLRKKNQMQQREIEELLELIWTQREKSISDKKTIVEKSIEKNPEKILEKMIKDSLVSEKGKKIVLSETGEKYAESIIRRHRLAERLFKDVFSMDESVYEIEACTWEHMLSAEATDSVCAFLGHPRVCPHNRPIPPGECCKKYKKEMLPLVLPLSEADIGTDAKIVYILPSLELRLSKLTNLGVIPGNTIHIKQKSPAFVISVEESTIAIDSDIAKEIFILKTNSH